MRSGGVRSQGSGGMESGRFSSFPVKYGGRRDAGALDEKKLAWQRKMAKVRVPLPDGHSAPQELKPVYLWGAGAVAGPRRVTALEAGRMTQNSTKKRVCLSLPRKLTQDTSKTCQVKPKTQQKLPTECIGHDSIKLLAFSWQRKKESSLGSPVCEYRTWVIGSGPGTRGKGQEQHTVLCVLLQGAAQCGRRSEPASLGLHKVGILMPITRQFLFITLTALIHQKILKRGFVLAVHISLK